VGERRPRVPHGELMSRRVLPRRRSSPLREDGTILMHKTIMHIRKVGVGIVGSVWSGEHTTSEEGR
jgi:hypothetical protein